MQIVWGVAGAENQGETVTAVTDNDWTLLQRFSRPRGEGERGNGQPTRGGEWPLAREGAISPLTQRQVISRTDTAAAFSVRFSHVVLSS